MQSAIVAHFGRGRKSRPASAALVAADANAALARYGAMNDTGAASAAKAAHGQALAAAAAIKVKVAPQASPADCKAKGWSTQSIDNVDCLHRLAS